MWSLKPAAAAAASSNVVAAAVDYVAYVSLGIGHVGYAQLWGEMERGIKTSGHAYMPSTFQSDSKLSSMY